MNDSSSIVLRMSELAAGYGRHVILRGVNWQVGRGERWFIVGPNGEGKSTLLRVVLSMLRPRSGEMWRDPGALSPKRIGFVPQRCDLNPTLPTTVREFVELGLVGLHVSAGERRTRFDAALKRVRLDRKAEANYWSLSGGQRQRALLARALIRNPATLVLDEPTSGLDLAATEALMAGLIELNRDAGVTLLFVTHDVLLARRHATHVAAVHGGEVSAGPAAGVLTDQRLQEMYGAPGISGPAEGAEVSA